jgi:hypothetical protein
MTEAEWIDSTDPIPMLFHLDSAATVRKLRLLACACCRRLWENLSDPARHSVEVSERYADGLVTQAEMQAARGPFFASMRPDNAASYAGEPGPAFRFHARLTLQVAATSAGWSDWVERIVPETETAEKASQADLVRDVFGNPFCLVEAAREWMTWTVAALAEGIYADRAFDRLPILADALQDAGCDNDDVLSHCRDTTREHVRGCWVIDLLLGKK